MYEPKINTANVHSLYRGEPKSPPTDDVMGVLLRELSDARPPDQCDRISVPDRNEANAEFTGPQQHAQGQGNFQVGAPGSMMQVARGNHNVQIADFQLVVQLGLTQPPRLALRKPVFRFRHIAMVGLLVVAFLC